jgi:hypothetical protein
MPFGYLSGFTANRKAPAITDNGAVPVKTARYTNIENQMSRTANVTIDLNGNATATVLTTYKGMESDEVPSSNYDEQKKWLQESTEIPVFDIKSFAIKNNRDRLPSSIVRLELTLNRFATVNGKRFFLNPNLMNRSSFIPPKVDQRKTKLVFRNGFTHTDTINYSISEHIYPEYLPEPTKIESRFGKYESSYKLDQGKVIYVRRFVKNTGEFPADTYNEFVDFYKAVNRADNVKIVFLNKT